MGYIFGLVIVAIFFAVLHYYTELSKSQKIGVTAIVTAVIMFAVAFNSYSDAQNQKLLAITTKFQQNKTVKCEGIDVNSTNFTLSVGTFTFIGKKETPYYGRMINASACEE